MFAITVRWALGIFNYLNKTEGLKREYNKENVEGDDKTDFLQNLGMTKKASDLIFGSLFVGTMLTHLVMQVTSACMLRSSHRLYYQSNYCHFWFHIIALFVLLVAQATVELVLEPNTTTSTLYWNLKRIPFPVFCFSVFLIDVYMR